MKDKFFIFLTLEKNAKIVHVSGFQKCQFFYTRIDISKVLFMYTWNIFGTHCISKSHKAFPCSKSSESIYKRHSIHTVKNFYVNCSNGKLVKITPYLFTRLLPRLTTNGPKQLTPTNVNDGLYVAARFAIFCWQGASHLLL